MGKSRKKTPVGGNSMCDSEKKDKRHANRAHRRREKVCVKEGIDPPDLREVSNVWCFGKDGKQYFGGKDYEEKFTRK